MNSLTRHYPSYSLSSNIILEVPKVQQWEICTNHGRQMTIWNDDDVKLLI